MGKKGRSKKAAQNEYKNTAAYLRKGPKKKRKGRRKASL